MGFAPSMERYLWAPRYHRLCKCMAMPKRRRWFAVLIGVGVRRGERTRRRRSSRCDRLLPLHRRALLRESSFDLAPSSAAQRVEW
ncbi:hypothetical protein [Oryza sativa Japonica Group]|uniref:Uncharacterized protein n=2 Tax=Oryza sativa subsp. japonica TaxID=39947 RepID=Q657J2_ORYSJ|nr:hypothetical protein [Oryza sativa Japonica Group]BAD45125.1 hypothetical protein [Oryza sativa Japonica Group]